MSLTKEIEFDCEVRGVHKNVQVRRATVVKDDGVEISRNYHRHVLHCRTKSGGSWVIPTSLMRMQPYRLYAMRFGQIALSLLMKLLWIIKQS